MRTRLWAKKDSSTMIQFRNDTPDCKIWMHTNLGWIAIGGNSESSAPDEIAERFAESCAQSYGLIETSQDTAKYYAGF
jgi:hypothetical protein